MIKSITRHREFTGPTPHSVAIIAKPTNKVPAEHLILERRRVEDLREKSIADTKNNKEAFLRSQWEKTTDRQIQKNRIKREVEKHISYTDMILEKRRDKLREILLYEEEQYIVQLETKEETTEDRQQRMKERAKELKGRREAERQEYVALKMEQKFSDECEELRSELSKRTRDEIFSDRNEQIKIKQDQLSREAATEQFYADVWEQDRLSKAHREEIETQKQIERNHSTLEILNLQRNAAEAQREEELKMKEMEAEWLKQEVDLRKYEDKLMLKEKKEKQKAARRARDISVKLKEKKEAKEKQEEMALDMKMLEKILQDSQAQAFEDTSKKKNQRNEMQRFMHYVNKTRRADEERERSLESLVNEQVENQWERKDARKRLEKEARKALMVDVMATREKQRQEREDIFRQEQQSVQKERQELLGQMEEHRRLENERIARIRMENLQYQNDLEQQISYQRQQKDKQIEEARRELELTHRAEKNYQRKLRSALTNPNRERQQHPLRITGASVFRAQSC